MPQRTDALEEDRTLPQGKFARYMQTLMPLKDELLSDQRLVPVHYDISLKTFPESHRLDVEVLITAEVPPEPAPYLRLYLGLPGLNKVKLKQVLLGGHAVAYTYQSPRLTIYPPSPPRAGQRIVVCVSYSEIPGAPKNYTGVRGSELNAEFMWLPLVGFPDKAFTARAVTQVPSGEETAFLGKRLHWEERDGRSLAEWETEVPITLPAFVSGPFAKSEGVAGGARVNVLVQRGYERAAAGLAENLARAMEAGTSWFGELPLSEIYVVQPRRREYGQYAHMPFVVLTRDDVPRDSDPGKAMRLFEATAHELGHFWWGNVVRSNVLDEGWLSEGFADFAKVLAVELAHGADARRDLLSRMLDELRKARPAHSQPQPEPPADTGVVAPVPALAEIRAAHPSQPTVVRRQGGLFLQAFRQYLGEDQARRFFRALYSRYRDSIMTTRAFEEMARATCPGPEMRQFLKKHLHGQVTYDVDSEGRVVV